MVAMVWAGAPVLAEDTVDRRDATVRTIEKVMPSVVNIQTKTLVERQGYYEDLLREFYGPFYRRRPADERYSVGSGVIIDKEGYLLTNLHVVQQATEILVKLADGRVFEADPIVGTRLQDVALLKLRCPAGEEFPAARFAADDDLLLGETVIALGIPFGLGGSVSRGILSSKSRRPPSDREPLNVQDWLQTDAAINPGNSGGPLVNLQGEVIGINVAVYREGQGIGFAIPIKRISEALAEIFTPEEIHGWWFGARIKPNRIPLEVQAVKRGSPAAQAGLQVGDLIVELNQQPVTGYISFINKLSQAGDQQSSALTIQRQGGRRDLRLKLVAEAQYYNADLIRKKTGISLQPLTPELAESLGLVIKEGLVVAGVEPSSPAARAGFQPQMIVQTINSYPVLNVVTAAKILEETAPGDTVVFSLLVQRVRGRFVQMQNYQASLKVR